MGASDPRIATSPAAFIRELRAAFVERGGEDRMLGDADNFVETFAPYATEDFTCLMEAGALTDRYNGLEGLREGWRDFLAAFEEIEIVPGELREAPGGDAVVEFVHLIGKPIGVAAEIDQQAAAVWRFRDGRLCAVEFHIDRGAAMRSAGLER
jgi:ketosteroid isomerase-like protein